jgi:hypothetical protein
MTKKMSAEGALPAGRQGSASGGNKKIICLIVLILIVVFSLGISNLSSAATASNTQYTLMEKIPGLDSTSGDLKAYIEGIYKFGVWTIGIAALLMIMIGGFMYMTSAGNNATMGKAKTYIQDAIIGLVMVMTAYLLLNTINPSLTTVTIKMPTGTGSGSGTGTTPGTGNSSPTNPGKPGSGKCEPVTSGPCSVDSLSANSCWSSSGADLSKISSICNAESGGVEQMSTSDVCGHTKGGTSFSCGAMQANLTCLCKGQNAFTGSEPAVGKGCASFSCTGAGPNYQSCVDQYCTGQGNLDAGCKLYKEHGGNKYDTWTKNQTDCKF